MPDAAERSSAPHSGPAQCLRIDLSGDRAIEPGRLREQRALQAFRRDRSTLIESEGFLPGHTARLQKKATLSLGERVEPPQSGGLARSRIRRAPNTDSRNASIRKSVELDE